MFLGVKAAVSVARYHKRNKQAGLWNQAEKQATSPLVVKKKKRERLFKYHPESRNIIVVIIVFICYDPFLL